jgi:hypothetical protein
MHRGRCYWAGGGKPGHHASTFWSHKECHGIGLGRGPIIYICYIRPWEEEDSPRGGEGMSSSSLFGYKGSCQSRTLEPPADQAKSQVGCPKRECTGACLYSSRQGRIAPAHQTPTPVCALPHTVCMLHQGQPRDYVATNPSDPSKPKGEVRRRPHTHCVRTTTRAPRYRKMNSDNCSR